MSEQQNVESVEQETEAVEGLPGNYPEVAIEAEINRCIAELDDGFKSIQRKSGAIILASSTMVSVFTALSVFSSDGVIEKWIASLTVLIFASTLSWMLWHGSKIWGPTGIAVFDATNAQSLYDQYVSKSPGLCYSQLMVDKCNIVCKNTEVNSELSKRLGSMILVFQIQVATIGVLAVVSLILKAIASSLAP